MSIINESLQRNLMFLIDNYRHARDLQGDICYPESLRIDNHNLFNCFLTIDCPSNTNYTVPVVCLNQLARLAYTGNFVFSMSMRCPRLEKHKCVSSFFKHIVLNKNHYALGIVKHEFFNGEVYYTYGNIIMDEDFNIILLPCVNIVESDVKTIKKAVLIVSPEVFNNPSKIIYKFMVKSFIPYMSNMESMPIRSNPISLQRRVPVEIEIADTHKFIRKPLKPTEHLEEAGNMVLRNCIDGLVRKL